MSVRVTVNPPTPLHKRYTINDLVVGDYFHMDIGGWEIIYKIFEISMNRARCIAVSNIKGDAYNEVEEVLKGQFIVPLKLKEIVFEELPPRTN